VAIRHLPQRSPWVKQMVNMNAILFAHGLIEGVCHRHGVTVSELKSLSRKGALTKARRDIIVYLRDKVGFSFPAIGVLINRDHSTVIRIYEREKGHDH
jgi:chromosomal replication initiation ATPase DnaA